MIRCLVLQLGKLRYIIYIESVVSTTSNIERRSNLLLINILSRIGKKKALTLQRSLLRLCMQ